MELKKIELTEIARIENSRSDDFDCPELMESIKESGLIQPVVVCKNFYTKTGRPYVLVAGNRRYKACKALGMKRVDAVINDTIKNEADLLIFNMSENLQRKDVSAFEHGRLIDILVRKHKMAVYECAVRIGLPRSKAQDMYSAYKRLPAKFTKLIANCTTRPERGSIPLSVAKEIANLKKSKYLSSNDANEILQGVVDGIYTQEHIRRIKRELRIGGKFDLVKKGLKKVKYVRLRVPVFESEFESVNGSVTDYVEQLIYGEAKDFFTRPKFK